MYLLVYILRHHPHGTYITELCHEIGVSKTTLSILIKKLREKGYLCFQMTPGDERKKRILPTARLNACADMFMALAIEMEDAVCSGIDTIEQVQLIALESKVHRHLEDMEERQRKDRRA